MSVGRHVHLCLTRTVAWARQARIYKVGKQGIEEELDVQVLEIADGRIISGAQAKEFGLIDVLGNFRDAVELAKKATGIEGEPTLVYPDKPGSRIWDFLFDDAAKAFQETLRKSLLTRIEYRWDGYSH